MLNTMLMAALSSCQKDKRRPFLERKLFVNSAAVKETFMRSLRLSGLVLAWCLDELAHNFGYRHGTSGVWIKDYPGYFPTELGFCVMSNGKNSSDLGDYELRRQFKDAR